jgi:hypothetical protein
MILQRRITSLIIKLNYTCSSTKLLYNNFFEYPSIYKTYSYIKKLKSFKILTQHYIPFDCTKKPNIRNVSFSQIICN